MRHADGLANNFVEYFLTGRFAPARINCILSGCLGDYMQSIAAPIYLQPTATVLSAFLGFFCGSLFNHYLTNRRRDRETSEGVVALLQAVIADLGSIHTIILTVRDLLAIRAGYSVKDHVVGAGEDLEFTVMSLKLVDYGLAKQVAERMPNIGWEQIAVILSSYRDAQAMALLAQKAVNNEIDDQRFFEQFKAYDQDQNIIENNMFLLQTQFLPYFTYRSWRKSYYKDYRAALKDGRKPYLSKERLDKAFNRRWVL
jgi:hypothetical protein